MNLNKFAKDITLKEGKKISMSIAQVKELLKIVLTTLGKLSDPELRRVLNRYRPKSKQRK